MESQLPPSHSVPRGRPHDRAGQTGHAPPLAEDPEVGGYHGHPPPQLSAAAMQAPRLQSGGVCGKLVVTSVCCMLLFVMLLAVNFVLAQPVVVQVRSSVHERLLLSGTPRAAATAQPRAQKPMPAILHRFGSLKRTPGSARGGAGAMGVPLKTAFPRWRLADGSLKLEEAIADLALGISALVEQLDPQQELRVVTGFPPPPQPPPPPLPEELPLPNDDSEQESEL